MQEARRDYDITTLSRQEKERILTDNLFGQQKCGWVK